VRKKGTIELNRKKEWKPPAVIAGVFLAIFHLPVGRERFDGAFIEVFQLLKGLIGSGMGKGPVLALLLSGPELSLPNMLMIRSVMGTKKRV